MASARATRSGRHVGSAIYVRLPGWGAGRRLGAGDHWLGFRIGDPGLVLRGRGQFSPRFESLGCRSG